MLHCVTSNVGLTGFGYSSSSGTEDEAEDGDKEDELSESEEDAERVWEMIRRKRSAFDRRMQAADDAHRGKSMSYWLLLCLSCLESSTLRRPTQYILYSAIDVTFDRLLCDSPFRMYVITSNFSRREQALYFWHV